MPFFSVIIPTYNRYDRVINAIDSVLTQSFRDHEIIVVDDCSTDKTPALEEIYGKKIRYIRNKKNSGVSASRNAGITISGSPYIAFLDSDDLWLPKKLEIQSRYIDDHPAIKIHQTDETWIRNGTRVNPGLRHRKIEGHIFRESLGLCLISPSSVVIERSVFDTCGMFDELLPACEDYDLWLRTTQREMVGLVPDRLIIKQGGHGDQLSKKFWGMDRFRIYSIIKVLSGYYSMITDEDRKAARETAIAKSAILLNGARRRNRDRWAVYLEDIITKLEQKDYNSIDYPNLLTEQLFR